MEHCPVSTPGPLALGTSEVVARSTVGQSFALFPYQAGGHQPLLRSAYGEVCKPAIPLELQFYRALELQFPQLTPFVPHFVGVITVELHETTVAPDVSTLPTHTPKDALESKCIAGTNAVPPEPTKATRKTDDESTTEAVNELLKDMHFHIPRATSALLLRTDSSRCRRRRCQSIDDSWHERSSVSTSSYSAKLWSREQQTAHTKRAKSGLHSLPSPTSDGRSREYLVLGDLTCHYSKPCVLDVKLGTRQHGADAPANKVLRHSAKCAATTSRSLGLRLCGMQVYDPVARRYALWNKHWGRRLRDDEIELALVTFFSGRRDIQWEALSSLLHRLLELQTMISNTTGLRFWGASLLLVYEGDLEKSASPLRPDLRLIDFAHCEIRDDLDTPDDGVLLGLGNMARFLTNILKRRPVATASSAIAH